MRQAAKMPPMHSFKRHLGTCAGPIRRPPDAESSRRCLVFFLRLETTLRVPLVEQSSFRSDTALVGHKLFVQSSETRQAET